MTITITRNEQPYTVETWHIDAHWPVTASDSDPAYIKARAEAGWVNVRGHITNSKTTSRLFNASSTRTVKSQPLLDQMPARYLTEGASYVTVAM